MPRIDPDSLPADQRWIAPAESHIFRTFVNSYAGLAHYRAMTKFIREESSVPERLREMALIQVGYACNCAYEYTHHVKTGLRCGVSPDDVHAIADETEGVPTALDPLTKAVLRMAREITLGFDVSEEPFALLQSELGNERLMELLFSVVTYVGTAKLLLTLRVELEDSYRPFLQQFPIRSRRTR
jgi:alkylhydroperoxidase family enzyme